jgi:hypothetical protein
MPKKPRKKTREMDIDDVLREAADAMLQSTHVVDSLEVPSTINAEVVPIIAHPLDGDDLHTEVGAVLSTVTNALAAREIRLFGGKFQRLYNELDTAVEEQYSIQEALVDAQKKVLDHMTALLRSQVMHTTGDLRRATEAGQVAKKNKS